MTKKSSVEIPRPPCSVCGGPGSHEVSLASRELQLEREAGANTKRYWSPSYRNCTEIKTFLCQPCMKVAVRINFDVSATIEKARQG